MLKEGILCRECRLAEPEFVRAVAYGVYADELRKLIHLLKYKRVRGAARPLGNYLAQTVLTLECEMGKSPLVVAVPLFATAERRRGYNQARLLADRLLRDLRRARPEWKLEAAHSVLTRQRSTESQYVLSRRGRRRNLRGAFAVTGTIPGREVLLIDDILTTGATARECARVLVKAGAAKVWVATVARAQSERLMRQRIDPSTYVATWDLAVSSKIVV